MSRSCAGCKIDISGRHKNVKYCSVRCKDAPRFYGTYCVRCGAGLIISRSSRFKTKYCSNECEQVEKRKNYVAANPGFNVDYFSTPNLKNSYWAGFIAADGCIVVPKEGQRRLQIKLAVVDKEHLESLRDALGIGNLYDREVYLKETGKTYLRTEYAVNSNKICNDLARNFNIHPRKSLDHEPPDLEGDLAYAFIAGYIDGDGCYFKVHSRLRINILGTSSLLNWIANIYEVGRASKKDNRDNVYRITFYGKDSVRMVESYKDLNLPFLKRKKSRWEDIGLVTDIDDEIEVKC